MWGILQLVMLITATQHVSSEDTGEMRYLPIHACLYDEIPGITYITTLPNGLMYGHTLQIDDPDSPSCNGADQQVNFGIIEVQAAKGSSAWFQVEVMGNADRSADERRNVSLALPQGGH